MVIVRCACACPMHGANTKMTKRTTKIYRRIWFTSRRPLFSLLSYCTDAHCVRMAPAAPFHGRCLYLTWEICIGMLLLRSARFICPVQAETAKCRTQGEYRNGN